VSLERLDQQLAVHKFRLQVEMRLNDDQCGKLATTIAADVRFLPQSVKDEIRSASPVPLTARYEELQGFQAWMDFARKTKSAPITRAQVITQNYVCFVYLAEACFLVFRKQAQQNSATKRVATFLTDNPVRAFRNAIAHSNWQYNEDFSGLIYWARKGPDRDEPLSKFEVDQKTLGFWQSLSRCAAYAVYINLK
jgi:hypothetical protein